MKPARRAAAPAGAVLSLLVLAVAGVRLSYDLAYRFATLSCPIGSSQPCAGGGFTNGSAYFLAWWIGGALVLSLVGTGLLLVAGTGWRTARGDLRHVRLASAVALTAFLASAGFVLAKVLAFDLLTDNQSLFCNGLGCEAITRLGPRPDFTAWGLGGAAAGGLVAMVLLGLGRAVRPGTRPERTAESRPASADG